MRVETRRTMQFPRAIFDRFRAFAARMQTTRGGKWTDPVTLQYLLEREERRMASKAPRSQSR